MKNTVLLALSGLLLLFLAITFLKDHSSEVGSQNDSTKEDSADKNKIQRFWQIHRQATTHRIAGRTQPAIEAYCTTLELNDQHENTLYYLGSLYFESGEFKKAENLWIQLVKVNPNSARAHAQLGRLYLKSGQEEFYNLESARIEFQKAMALNKEETGPLLHLGQIALIEGNFTEAAHYFSAVTGSNFKSVEAHYLSGFVWWKQGHSQKALLSLKKALKYLLPEKPIHGLPGEGDTKTGESLGKSTQQILFPMNLHNLIGLDDIELAKQMETRFQKLESFLEQIRKERPLK